MKLLSYSLFLIFFILTGVLVLGNWSYQADEFFFLATFHDKSLALPFLWFAALGSITGMLFILAITSLFKSTEKVLDSALPDTEQP